jgi:23S rRNA pseudouridine1911/1915/1917 synthase
MKVSQRGASPGNLGEVLRSGGKISLVYEDENIAIFDKPPGLLTIPAPRKGGQSLQEILDSLCAGAGFAWKLHPCHRLDADTSGLVIFAKGKARQKIIMELFSRREIKKTYIAFTQGTLPKTEGVFTRSLAGETARTAYRALSQHKLWARVEVRPETGRKNQIRLHFKAAGHPLVGETRFAFRKDFPLKAKRLMLHALRLEFNNPWTGEALTLEAPLPPDMEAFAAKNSAP